MPRISAGLLMFRLPGGAPEVFLVHPGGPFFRNKDEGAWSIPKGEDDGGEDLLPCAIREFREETGMAPAAAEYLPLGEVRQSGGKVVHAWAFEGAWDDDRELASNTFEIEWPPKSGKRARFPEIDAASFSTADLALRKINAAQRAFVERLLELRPE